MHPTAGTLTPLIVLLQDDTCLRDWLASLPPRQSVGFRLCASECPLTGFLKAHGVPVAHVDQQWIVLTTGEQLETPGWLAVLIESIDTHLHVLWDSTTIDLSVTAGEVLDLLSELDEEG
jgi:hypothetical protein